MSSRHPVDALFRQLQKVSPYPEGVVPVPKRIAETAFFPGGAGLWGTQANQPLPPMPIGQVMILGHDFDTEAGFHESLYAQSENLKCPTWRNLLWLLDQVGIPAETCFFTNLYMGLRAGHAKVTGRFPGSRYPRFVKQCRTFLTHQIKAQRPRLILTLGAHVPSAIAPLSPDLADWSGFQRFQDLDEGGHALIPRVHFAKALNVQSTVVALTHPSLWHRCVMTRRYGNLAGKAAELTLLQNAMEMAGIAPCSHGRSAG